MVPKELYGQFSRHLRPFLETKFRPKFFLYYLPPLWEGEARPGVSHQPTPTPQWGVSLAYCPAVFLSYFSLWICYEIKLTIQRTNWATQVGWVGQLTKVPHPPLAKGVGMVPNVLKASQEALVIAIPTFKWSLDTPFTPQRIPKLCSMAICSTYFVLCRSLFAVLCSIFRHLQYIFRLINWSF